MGINLDKVKERLRQLQVENDVVKSRILKKLNSFYSFLCWYRDINFMSNEHFDLDYLQDLIVRYKEETEYLTKEDLVKVNKMCRKYKYHEHCLGHIK